MDIWEYRTLLRDALDAWKAKESGPFVDVGGKGFAGRITRSHERLGILGGGVLALSRARGRPVLLYAPEIQRILGNDDIEDIVTTQTNYDCCENHKGLVDLLFLVARDTPLPEFVSLIRKTESNSYEYPFETSLRLEYRLLHCSAGEIMAFCLYWKMLMGLIHHLGDARQLYHTCVNGLTGISRPCDLDSWSRCVASCGEESTMLGYFGKMRHQATARGTSDDHRKRSAQILASVEKAMQSLDFHGWSMVEEFVRLLGIGASPENWKAFTRYARDVLDLPMDLPSLEEVDWNSFGRAYFECFSDHLLGKKEKKPEEASLVTLLSALHDEARFPVIAYAHILLFDEENSPKEHLAFPIWHAFDPNTVYRTQPQEEGERSVLYCLYTITPPLGWLNYSMVFGQEENATDWQEYKRHLGKVIDELSALVNPYVDKAYYSDENKRNVQAISSEAKKAAISQVLARTLSHNLGSHSLNALATKQGMMDWLGWLSDQKSTTLAGRIEGLSEVEWQRGIPVYAEWLACYNNYLRERMDFLADITTAVPAFETRTHFKDDLLKGFAENHLLTTTIAGSPGFDYCWHVEGDDTLVAIPSDVLGRHAFYVILENIVRNSAKHGGHKETVQYSVRVDQKVILNDTTTDLVEVMILDNKERDQDSVNILVKERNVNIDKPVLGEDGRVRERDWGMLEMKACAAYLRRVALEELDDDRYKVSPKHAVREAQPLLQAFHSKDGRFGYKFYLRKPQLVLFTGEAKEALFADRNADELRDAGFLHTTVENAKAGHENYLHRLWCHVHTAENADELPVLVKALVDDPARFPHQVLVVCSDAAVTKEALSVGLDPWGQELIRRTVMLVEPGAVDELPKDVTAEWEDSLYWRMLGSWLQQKAIEKKLHYNGPAGSNPVLRYLADANEDAMKITVDYQHHGEGASFYGKLHRKLNNPDKLSGVPTEAVNIEDALLNYQTVIGYKEVLVPYASGVSNAMDMGRINNKADLALQHGDYWLGEMVVVDERIQRVAHQSKYALKSSVGERVWVKHLADCASVWIPHADDIVDLNADVFTAGMWNDQLLPWLAKHAAQRDYLFFHLGVLEKFKTCLPGKEVEHLFQELRVALPGVRIIVISSRGKPSGLPKTVSFMSYSAVAQYITQDTRRCPMLLHELARAGRRIQPNKA